jgi:hypothetical protein
VGSHTHPELLDAVVEQMVEHVAKLEQRSPGLKHGTTIQYGWTHLTVRAEGPSFILCEPDWYVEPRANHQAHVTFSAMQLVQGQLIVELTGAKAEDCSCHDTAFVERGALEASRCVMARGEPASDTDSGWVLRCSSREDVVGAAVPMTLLAAQAPQFLRVVHLPRGWRAMFEDGAVEAVFDADGKQRMPSA